MIRSCSGLFKNLEKMGRQCKYHLRSAILDSKHTFNHRAIVDSKRDQCRGSYTYCLRTITHKSLCTTISADSCTNPTSTGIEKPCEHSTLVSIFRKLIYFIPSLENNLARLYGTTQLGHIRRRSRFEFTNLTPWARKVH